LIGFKPVRPPVQVTAPYGVVPPEGIKVIVPVAVLKQEILVCDEVTVKAVAG
jgi:hypothetical protein